MSRARLPGGVRLRAARRALLSVAVAGSVLVAGLVVERASLLGEAGGGTPWQIDADLSLTGFSLEQVGAQGTEMRLKADRAQMVEANRVVEVEGIDAAFYQNGLPAVQLAADTGRLALDEGVVRVAGTARPARLTLADGTHFTAPALVWDPKARTVRSEGGAELTGEGFSARGDEAVADARDQRVDLTGDVTVRWTP